MAAYSVIELINQNMPAVSKTVDLTVSRVSADGSVYEDGLPDPALKSFMPMQTYLDAEVALMKLKRSRPSLGYVVGLDQELPMDREQLQLSLETIGNLKIAKSAIFTEEDFVLIRKADMLMRMGAAGTKAAQEIRNSFMARPAFLAQSVTNTLALLTLRCLVIGKAAYTDPRTDLAVELSYQSQVPSAHFAATKTGNGRWSQPNTANGIQDIVDHLNAYYATFRRYPPFIAMGSTEWMNLRNQASTREIVARGKGLITEVGSVDAAAIANLPPPMLGEVSSEVSRRLARSDGSPGTTQLVVTDAVYYSRAADGVVTTAAYFPAGYYAFMWPSMSEQAIVPNAANDFAGGLATTTELLKKDPRREQVSVSGCCVPLIADPRMIGSRNVENSAIA